MDYNTRIVLIGSVVLGLSTGVVGSFAVLRRRALLGDALAHAALPGICLAYLIVGRRHFAALLLGAAVTGTLGVLIVSFLRHKSRIKEDAAIGMVLSVFFGGGIVLSRIIQNTPGGNRAGLDSYIFGKAASMVRQDVLLITAVCAVVLALTLLFYKEFKLLSFDRAFAATQGWPTLRLDIVMMALLVIVTVVGLPAVGIVLMAAMLIIPGAAARFWTERLHRMLILAALFGAVTGAVGTLVSARFARLPAGPIIVLVGTSIFLLSMLVAPRRGLIARVASRLRLQRRTARQNLLRTLYELAEPDPDRRPPCHPAALVRLRAWSVNQARRALQNAARSGLVEPLPGDRFRLTDRGLRDAARVVRTHRLWEMFLIDQAHVAADHVDRDADALEHILSSDIIHRLERRLVELGRWPHAASLPPPSPHHIAGTGDNP